MSVNTPYDQYKKNSILTSSPEELTLMLYNGLVKFIMQAQMSIEKKDMAKAHSCIVRSKEILTCFENTLEMKYTVSNDLLKMYEYMLARLTQANIKKDLKILDEILGMAKGMRDTWAEAMKISKNMNKSGYVSSSSDTYISSAR
jgi:flagellar biosynthetic protein FliS